MSDTTTTSVNKNTETMKQGLAFIDERTKQFRYADDTGGVQWTQPISRYKALTEIKRGQAISVATKDELYEYAYKQAAKQIDGGYSETTSNLEKTSTENVNTSTKTITDTYKVDNFPISYVKTTTTSLIESGSSVETTENFYYNDAAITLPYTVKGTGDIYETVYELESISDSNVAIKCTVYNKYETTANAIIGDPEACVVPTNTKKHEKSIGLALDYAEGYGHYVHVASFGKFTFDKKYEGKQTWFYEGTSKESEGFDHTGKEYNPGFKYEDVGKKVYVKCPYTDDDNVEHLGELTLNETETYKNYHNIICIGILTDAPDNDDEKQTTIEIEISGDPRGLVDATQYEVTLGEDIIVPSTDPIRVLAVGQEEDTYFKAQLCLTPQNNTEFIDSDFIAFQKMDGETSILYFGSTSPVDSSAVISSNEDASFLHMAECYADIAGKSVSATKVKDFNDTDDTDCINKNIETLKVYLENAYKEIIEYNLADGKTALTINSTKATSDSRIGILEIEANNVGGYYTLYVSSSMLSRMDGTVTICGGSYNNKGKAVLADIRIPTRRALIGVYYGSVYDKEIEKGSATLAMRLGEYDIPDVNNQFNSWEEGQEYYLGTNGRVVKYPYNQYDFVSKVGVVKSDANGDKRLLVDIGSATRHYNGDLPVGYMKPSVRVGTEYAAEYGFALMDGKTQLSKTDYEALYTRLTGWFDSEQIKAETGMEKTHFKVPKVVRMMPGERTEDNTEPGQIEVPMQIKAIADGIYEEMPRIPFKRFFGQFLEEDYENPNQKAYIDTACEITELVDYGISEDGYTLPTLDTFDIHLFVDIDEDWSPESNKPHNWREIHEGFFNYNNTNTYGYVWKIEQSKATKYHPFGCYTISMDIGEGEGVAFVNGNNQAPVKLTGHYYKLYIARREVFTRQFDIEAIYRNYITDSIYTDDTNSSVVINKAVSGKAVLDAIKNLKSVTSLSIDTNNKENGTSTNVALGPIGNPIDSLTLNTKTDLPIISEKVIYIGNDDSDKYKDNAALIVKDSNVYKNGSDNIYDYSNGKYTVEDNELVNAAQARAHAEATIDNKSYETYLSNNATNKTGRIHGMIFGKGGNIDVNSIWGLTPKFSSNINVTDNSNITDGYIPLITKDSNNNYTTYIEGDVKRVISEGKSEALTESIKNIENISSSWTENETNTTSSLTNAILKTTELSNSSAYVDRVENNGNFIQSMYNLENGSLQIIARRSGVSSDGSTSSQETAGATLLAGKLETTSLSKYKRIHGELIRDSSLETTLLATDSIKYETDSENKLKTTLGSALQAAYELPLAYWQYNTESEWSKDSLGIIIERVNDVANNIRTIDNSTKASFSWDGNTATAKTAGEDGNDLAIYVLTGQGSDEAWIYIYKKDNDNNYVNVLGFTDDYERPSEKHYTEKDINENEYIDFNIAKWSDVGDTTKPAELAGGKLDKKSVSRDITTLSENSDYRDNDFHYTDKEEESISEFLKSIINNSENGQNITSTVGMLLMAAKESQERLLKLEASTFGRDYDTIPGEHAKYNIAIPGVTTDPTNYGLNRLVRAICKELYYDTNPFDLNGNINAPTSSFSKIDHLNQDIHGTTILNNATDVAPNELSDIESSSYPYDDVVNSTDDTAIRLGTYEGDKKDIVSKGKNVESRVDMDNPESNTASDPEHFNGLVDAIYRITTKLNALTVSVNNSDNIADEPVRLNTIRENIATLLKEAFFNGNATTTVTRDENGVITETKTSINENNNYKDVSGEKNTTYSANGNKSRLEMLSEALYKYTLTLTQSSTVLGLPLSAETKFGNENKYYTTRKFNGKELLVESLPETSGDTNLASVNMAVPDNIENYNYANVIDILIDAIGDDWIRKAGIQSTKADPTDSDKAKETRSGETITERLENIEKCLDVIVSKISRKYNFEKEIDNGITANDIDNVSNTTTNSNEKVYSIEKYLGFLNGYLGTYQEAADGDLYNQIWSNNYEATAENTILVKENIQAGLENMLSRLQAEEAKTIAFNNVLGEDYTIPKAYNNGTLRYNLTDDVKDILLTLYGQDLNGLDSKDSNDYITDSNIFTQHRSLISNSKNRFLNNNVIDAIVNEMYYLPQPVKLGDDNKLSNISASTKATEDSRSATYYNFDAKNNVYDIVTDEKALGYNNRDEFFNDIGYFKDNETINNDSLHYRWSRFEVIENEIRSLRHLIGNDLSLNSGDEHSSDWQDLKFKGNLKYTDSSFNGAITSASAQTEATSILQFILNTNTASQKLRNELGVGDNVNQYYDSTYPSSNSIENSGTTVASTMAYNLYKADENTKKTIYDRVSVLEKNATQVDAWLDSIKDNYRSEKNGNNKGNIFDIIDYIGNYTWNDDKSKYYGKFGSLGNYLQSTDNVNKIKTIGDSKAGAYGSITDNLSAHNEYIQNIYDIIGFDSNEGINFASSETAGRNVDKKNTLWARINAVETLNKNDVDLTNILTANASVYDYDSTYYANTSAIEVTSRSLNENTMDSLVTSTDNMTDSNSIATDSSQAAMVASVGYVDNAIKAKSNEILSKTDIQLKPSEIGSLGTYNFNDESNEWPGVWGSIVNITDDYPIYNDKGEASYGCKIDAFGDDYGTVIYASIEKNVLTEVKFENLNSWTDYYRYKSVDNFNKVKIQYDRLLSTQNILKLFTTSIEASKNNHTAIRSVYSHVNSLYDSFGLSYNSNNVRTNTTGSLLTWDSNNTYGTVVTDDILNEFLDSCTYEKYGESYDNSVDYYTWITIKPNADNGDTIENRVWANFRQLPGLNAYRGATPCCDDKGRRDIAAKLVEENDINCILNLEDTKKDFEYLKEVPSYITSLYSSGHIGFGYINCNESIDSDDNKDSLGSGIKSLLDATTVATAPMYIHCVEGKYRAGFVSFLFECLGKVSYESMQDDFMTSYYNYYGPNFTKGTQFYTAGIKKWFNWMPSMLLGYANLGFDSNTTPNSDDLYSGAVAYLKACGLSDDDISKLKSLLGINN